MRMPNGLVFTVTVVSRAGSEPCAYAKQLARSFDLGAGDHTDLVDVQLTQREKSGLWHRAQQCAESGSTHEDVRVLFFREVESRALEQWRASHVAKAA